MKETTKNTNNTTQTNNFKKILSTIFYIIIAILLGRAIAIGVQNNIASRQPIQGDSMSPTILTGQNLILRRTNHSPKRGEVIVFKAKDVDPALISDVEYIKRVIAVGGDTVEKKGGKLFVNGKLVNQKYLQYKSATFFDPQSNRNITTTGNYQKVTGSNGIVKVDSHANIVKNNWTLSDLSQSAGWNNFSRNTTKVPKNCYFVMGDNRAVSNDSRYFGYVPRDKVVGVAFAPAWLNIKEQRLVNDQYKHFFQ